MSNPSRIGKYTLLKKIAAGGMAEVYLAKASGAAGFERVFAVKKILPHFADREDFVSMFTAEAKLSAQLVHQLAEAGTHWIPTFAEATPT